MDYAEIDRLRGTLNNNLKTIRETFKMLEHADSCPVKCKWSDAVQKGQELAIQAACLEYLFGGDKPPDLKEFKENMDTLCIMLQELVMLSLGSSTQAGPTMVSSIRTSIEEVIDSTSLLLEQSLSLCAFIKPKLPIPQMVGILFVACSDLKETPSTNVMAIGQAMTQVSDSVKFTLQDIEDLSPSGQPDEASGETSMQVEEDPGEEEEDPSVEEEDPIEYEEDPSDDEEDPSEDKDLFDKGLGEDLSPEDMEIVHSSANVVYKVLMVIKELIRCTTGLLRHELLNGGDTVKQPLENLLKLCERYGVTADELSMCLFPEKQIPLIKNALKNFVGTTDEIETEVGILKASSEDFMNACTELRSSLRVLESKLSRLDTSDLEQEMKNLAVAK